MTSEQSTEFIRSLEELFGLKPTIDPLALAVMVTHLRKMDHKLAIKAYTEMLDKTGRCNSLSQAYQVLKETYITLRDKSKISYGDAVPNISFEDDGDPKVLKAKRFIGEEGGLVLSYEAQAFRLFGFLVRYKYIPLAKESDIPNLKRKSDLFKQLLPELESYVKEHDEYPLQEAGKYFNNIIKQKVS